MGWSLRFHGVGNASAVAFVLFVLMAAGMAGLFHYVPNTHVRWRHAIAGAFWPSAAS